MDKYGTKAIFSSLTLIYEFGSIVLSLQHICSIEMNRIEYISLENVSIQSNFKYTFFGKNSSIVNRETLE